ncbi:ribose transport system permease protein [Pseudoxanthobacter soli DSM 19599]|uniref:Ribose transport system permease protein n=1 Tax=Pseudoxanthobacter soli DSM 19599 TaxID=1123029 RepID=A0A1M7ZA51_9HYPH|nr:ABC transporter permease [Pseudoxanthobacter soli]SHO61692.1 ribose transport system permease protein [Pseudoxanthobacter soli DSM 19599]
MAVLSAVRQALRGQARSRRGAQGLALLLLVIVALFLAAVSDRFTSVANLSNLLIQAAPLLLVALGQTVVILAGGLDVSVGAVVGLATAIVASPLPPEIAVPLALAAGAAVGAVNGILVGPLRLHPIVATLSTGSIVTGLALTLRPTPGGNVPGFLIASANERFLGIPLAVCWSAVGLFVAWWILSRTRLGLHILSLGGSTANARLNGIPVQRRVIAAYVICAIFAAFGGLLLAGRISSGDATVGLPLTVSSLAAVALGGTQMTGGIGGVLGTLMGSLLLAMLANGMNLMNVSPFLQSILNGVLLLIAISFTRRRQFGL